ASKSLLSQRSGTAAAPRRSVGWVVGAVLILALPAAWWMGRREASPSGENPLANAKFTRLTDFEGAELAAEISPDGRFVAFLSNRDGPFDVFMSQVGTGRFLNLTQGKQGDILEPTRSTGFSGDGSEIWLRGGLDRITESSASRLSTPIRLMPLMG